MSLFNCKGCGKVIGETPSGFCDACKGIDPSYTNLHKVKDYLYDNPNSSITVVSQDTGVSIGEISRYIREGTLKEISGFSAVSSGKCSCGNPLEGSDKICKSCKRENERSAERIKKELANKIASADSPKPAEVKKAGFYTQHKD